MNLNQLTRLSNPQTLGEFTMNIPITRTRISKINPTAQQSTLMRTFKGTSLAVCLCLMLSVLGDNFSLAVHAHPQPTQAEDESLLNLLLEYKQQVFTLGGNHPKVLTLRSEVDKKLQAGETLDSEQIAAKLDELKEQYRTNQKQLGNTHPSTVNSVATLALLTELLVNEPAHTLEKLDDLNRSEKWLNGVLYVSSGRHTGTVTDFNPEAGEVVIAEGSDDGLKIGMHFHLYIVDDRNRPWNWKRSGDSYILGHITSLEPKRSVIKLQSKFPDMPQRATVRYSQPSFKLGTLLITVRFDEAAWQNRPLMNAFLGDLLHSCTSQDSAKLQVLVTDTPRTNCQIDLLPPGLKGLRVDQIRTVQLLDSYIKEQPYFSMMKLNSYTLSPKPESAGPGPGPPGLVLPSWLPSSTLLSSSRPSKLG